MAKWIKSKYVGVRWREHPTRLHGLKPDRYFTIFYKLNGKMVQEALGWASEKSWTELKASNKRGELLKKHQTYREEKKLAAQERALQLVEGLTLAEFWEKDYVHKLKTRIKETSWEKEITHYTKRILPVMGHKPLKEITPEDIDLMLDRMREDKLTPRTQQYAVGTLYRIWKHAATRKVDNQPLVKAGDNPAIGMTVKKVNNDRLRVLTPQEFKSILDHLRVTDPAAHDITLFCAFTGCRFSEAGRLTWEHVNFSRSIALFPDTKNKDPRTVYLVPAVIEVLERRGIGGPGEHVFTMKDGSPFSQPPHAFRTAVKNLELNKGRGPRDKVCFHSLRHTAATLAARRGVPVKDMQTLFGWKTPDMVFKYCKADEEIQRRAMTGLAQSLAPEPSKVVALVKKG